MEDIDRKTIASCIEANPGLISGFKLRMVGPVVQERGEEVIKLAKEISNEHHLPLMVHIGDGRAPDKQRASELTRLMLKSFTEGDILTHLCTPHPGGVMDPADAAKQTVPELNEARNNGALIDSALGRGNFGIEVARRQAEMGVQPDTTSSDLTAGGRKMGVGRARQHGQVHVARLQSRRRGADDHHQRRKGHWHGRQARRHRRRTGGRLSIIDVVDGNWKFTDTLGQVFTGAKALVPVQTMRAGEMFSPDWGPYPWGWLPEEA